jgi:hypothetical protein
MTATTAAAAKPKASIPPTLPWKLIASVLPLTNAATSAAALPLTTIQIGREPLGGSPEPGLGGVARDASFRCGLFMTI